MNARRALRRARALSPALALVVVMALGGLTACEPDDFSLPNMIPNDCSVNVSAAINSWIDAVPDGSSLHFRAGCYRIDQTIEIDNRHDLEIDGGGATFQTNDPTGDGSPLSNPSTAARTRAHFRLVGGSGIHLFTMTIRGANAHGGTGDSAYVPDLEAQHGVDVEGTEDANLDNLNITNVYGDFVYFGRNGSTFSSGRLHHSRMSANGRQGVSVTAAHDVTIDHNNISNTRRSTFDLEPNGPDWSATNVIIRDNKIGAGRLLFVAAAGTGLVAHIMVLNNTLVGKPMNILVKSDATARRSDFWIAKNTSNQLFGTTGPAAFLVFNDIDLVRIQENTQPVQAGRGVSGVDAAGSTAVNVTNNSFVDAYSVLETPVANAYVCGNQLVAKGPFNQPKPC